MGGGGGSKDDKWWNRLGQCDTIPQCSWNPPSPSISIVDTAKEIAFDIAMNFSKWAKEVFELPKTDDIRKTGMMWKMTFGDDDDDDEYGVI